MWDIILAIAALFAFFYLKFKIGNLEERVDDYIRKKEKEPAVQPVLNDLSAQRNFGTGIAPEADLPPAPPLASPAIPVGSLAVESKAEPEEGLEFKFGSKIFTGVGVVAIIFAIGFFLSYAFENNLINETARILLGILGGMILLGIGEATRKKFPAYGQALTGGGLGALYVSIYAAFNFYHLISYPLAFLAMTLVTFVGVMLSLRWDSIILAGMTLFGGLITPLILPNGSGNPHILFLYLILLNIGTFLIASKKLWKPLILESFIGTVFVYLYWFLGVFIGQPVSQFPVAEIYATIFFLIFFAISLVQNTNRKDDQGGIDLAIVAANPVFYFLVSYAAIDRVYPDWTGSFVFSLAAFYLLSFLASKNFSEKISKLFQQFLLSIGCVLAIIAVPVQFHESWITISWCAEGLALIFLGFKMKFLSTRLLGHAAFFLSVLRLFMFETHLDEGSSPIINIRFFIFLAAIGLLSFGAYLYRRYKNNITDQDDSSFGFSLLAAQAAIVLLFISSFEVWDFFDHIWLGLVWAVGGFFIGWLGIALKDRALRIVAYIAFFFSFLRLVFFDGIKDLKNYDPILNLRFLILLCAAGEIRLFSSLLDRSGERVGQEEKKAVGLVSFLASNFLMLFLISTEIIAYFNQQIYNIGRKISSVQSTNIENLKNTYLSVAWALYAIGLFVIGLLRKANRERFLAIALFCLVILKVFLFDTASLNDFYRFISFITLGCILLLVGYLYYRFKDRIVKFIKAE